MTRRKLVAGNWKMNGIARDAGRTRRRSRRRRAAAPGVDVAVAVPFTLIAPAAQRVPGLAIGAEDVHEADKGAHTGCVSAAMVGRRARASRSSAIASAAPTSTRPSHDAWAKAAAAHRQGLQRDPVRAARPRPSATPAAPSASCRRRSRSRCPTMRDGDWLTLAYEPLWAIGTGRTPTLDEIARDPRDRARQAARR